MPEYRRAKIGGAVYFFTVALRDRTSSLLIDRIDDLRSAFRQVKRQHPFEIVAIAVLPEHLHALLRLPIDDHDFPNRWRLIKTRFSHAIPRTEPISSSRESKGERGIWQRRYWEHLIRDESDLENHVSYIHFNPVKHGHVARVCDWPHSSFHRFVEAGTLPLDWAGMGDSGPEGVSFGDI